MDKRLSRTDLGFSLMFLLMLVIAIGAFFYGVKIGGDRVRAEFADAADTQALASQASPNAYQQQDLVSFYHTVFLSYREFENEWFSALEKWKADPSADLAASLKELAKTADAKYAKIKVDFVSPSSPLLTQAQNDFMKSLKLFSESFSALAKDAGSMGSDELIRQLDGQAFFTEGRKFALDGQNNYYTSMLKWGASVNPDIPGDYETPNIVSLDQWKSLPLLIKNKISADYLSDSQAFTEFLPHDLTARIDQFIQSGQAGKMKQTTIGSVAELLTGTDAVRNGDFMTSRASLYADELLPQLPFFISER